jgi:hypothetical protein
MADIATPNDQGPFHLVNHRNIHIGPFTSALDAAFAKNIGDPAHGWSTAMIMSAKEFKTHMKGIRV